MSSEVETSLDISEIVRDSSTTLGMTEVFSEHFSMEKVTIRVPASTSNLGPGFDCLGVALRIYNFMTVSRAAKQESLAPIAAKAASLFFKRTKHRRFTFSCSAL